LLGKKGYVVVVVKSAQSSNSDNPADAPKTE